MDRISHLESKVDRLSLLMEEWHADQLQKKTCPSKLFREMMTSTVLGGVLGYFMFRLLDYHFGDLFVKKKK